jgi:histidine ammonia-lyase
MTAALLALDSLDRAETVVAIEILCAAQALETGTRRPGQGVARLYAVVRGRVPALEEDRPPAPDIAAARDVVGDGTFAGVVQEVVAAEAACRS